jgi:hypothetical protein
MLVPKPFYKKPRFWRWAVSLSLLLLLVYVFRLDILVTLDYLLNVFPRSPLNLPQLKSVLTIFALVAFGVAEFVFLSFLFVSQFVLPVQNPTDRWTVFKRLLYYSMGTHGPAVFIKEGEEIARPEELQSYRPGVAFVDLASAVVLEKQWSGGGSRTTLGARLRSSRSNETSHTQDELNLTRKQNRDAKVRAAGPGIVFTHFGERLRGTVGLRRQFRLSPNVRGITRDGFEIFTHVYCLFTLGQPPQVLKVIYQGESKPENLKVLQIDESKNTIKRISAELDAEDTREIHRFIESLRTEEHSEEINSVSDENFYQAPYEFDADRVFNAVYGERRQTKDGNVQDWTTLPVQVAIEIFRDMLSIANYDDLYKPADAQEFPFKTEFRPRLSARVRNQGVLAYQFVQRKDGLPLEEGQVWDIQQMDIFPTRNLVTSKVLRDRGIRVIASGCAELRPTNQAIFQQRFNHWQAGWQQNADKILAGYEYKALQIRSHARAIAQRDICMSMGKLLQTKIPDEVLAIRLLGALEAYATQPETKRLLPRETISTMGLLNQWVNSDARPSSPTYDRNQP